MKIAIGICEKINGKCSTMGCFRTYNNKEKHFSQYKDIETELISLFSCNICSMDSKENIITIAERLKNSEVDRVHLGTCAVKCKADRKDEIKEIFESMNIEVVEGTH
ncbi:CGGC domain-containing protein [Tissierella sp. MB52-C2]|uniref:CGGC domain-containing protein n=1 Tax=Tissierella sp. MB52-C2 TaxID=3070999 RepID=UPI00280ADC35|nr:CGGC domain-containing protein [Tissierella sp. MB52-C2]WMM24614.1 CGGC domain-containing protein [Tissierella sp. MB52-C2]